MSSTMPPPIPAAPAPVPATGFPIVVHYNRTMGVFVFGCAVASFVFALMSKNSTVLLQNSTFVLMLIFPVVFGAVGIGYMFGKFVIIEPNLVSCKSPMQVTVKRRSIDGLADLYFVGNTLYRRSDNKKLQNMGFGASNSKDLNALKHLVGTAVPSGQR